MLHVDNNLLEAGELPIARLAVLANKESRQPQAVYSTHKWFARRLGTSMRALLLGLRANDIDQFWQLYDGPTEIEGHVLDPFVGGGTTVTEAARLGMRTIGVDIDPVAVAITGFQMTLPTLKSVEPLIEKLQMAVGVNIEDSHKVEGPDDKLWTAVHHFWVQSIECSKCSHHYDLHPHYVIAETPASSTKTVLCRSCGALSNVKMGRKNHTCSCGIKTKLESGTTRNGRATCPACDHSEDIIENVRKTGAPPQFKLFAHEIIANPNRRRPSMVDRQIVSATEKTRTRYEAARILAASYSDQLPSTRIGVSHQDSRLRAYNRTRLSSLFNGRQQLHLGMLLKTIKTFKGEDRKVASIAFSDHLRTNNMLCGYSVGWRRLRPLFAIRGWHHVVRPVELNPWLCGIGRGTFINALERIDRARLRATQPRGTAASNLTEFTFAEIHQGSSAKLHGIKDQSIDVVLTDPPYFDKVSYAELADFFRPWLRKLGITKSGMDLDDQLGTIASDSYETFVDRLSKCLQEATRTLKPHGRFVFTYQSDAEGWTALAHALYRSGLHPITCFPLLGDAGSGDHKRIDSKRWDAVLCLEKPKGWKRRRGRVLRCDADDIDWARAISAKYNRKLARSSVPFARLDKLNLEAASLSLACLRCRDRKRSAPRLEKVLKSNAKVRQEGPKPVHS